MFLQNDVCNVFLRALLILPRSLSLALSLALSRSPSLALSLALSVALARYRDARARLDERDPFERVSDNRLRSLGPADFEPLYQQVTSPWTPTGTRVHGSTNGHSALSLTHTHTHSHTHTHTHTHTLTHTLARQRYTGTRVRGSTNGHIPGEKSSGCSLVTV